MDRCAVFVDAGYLFAQGSVAIAGSKKPRSELLLDPPIVIDELIALARTKAEDCRILRVYWYDGAIGGSRPTSDQALVANLDNVKLRLGFINSYGQQKGVDSLIVTDLIELARLKSITDALLLSGDHDRIATFLTVRETATPDEAVVATQATASATMSHQDAFVDGKIAVAVMAFVESLVETDIKGVEAYWETARGVPPDLDRKLLSICGAAIGRKLERDEIREMRTSFQLAVKRRAKNSN
jgi:hypothetical protein